MYINASGLFEQAIASYQAASKLPRYSIEGRRETLASILYAVISAEAFINELHHLTRGWNKPDAFGWVKALVDLLEEAEKSRASLESKYQLAMFILSGEPFDRGAAPFQEFALLIAVRNLIVHAKPLVATLSKNASGKYIWTEPKIMVRLQSAGVVPVPDDLTDLADHTSAQALSADVLGHISTEVTALWACTAAAGIVNGVLEAIPDPFGATMKFLYREFQKTPSPITSSSTVRRDS